MLLLTITAQTQGQMPGDFCHGIEGELAVTFADCRVPAHLDDMFRCQEGCPVRFFGLGSHECSTTAMVRDVPVSRDDLLLAVRGYAEHRGSIAPLSIACLLAAGMVGAAFGFAPGAVIGIRDGKLAARREPADSSRYLPRMLGMARAFAWRRYYGKTLEDIDPDASQL